mmetsp:Transcript_27626/g.92804  ORF Transcript_27626/g.92804 Transcript_27626/m.92804 type:complete len:115 (+) Transcript_27626:355-699(+)
MLPPPAWHAAQPSPKSLSPASTDAAVAWIGASAVTKAAPQPSAQRRDDARVTAAEGRAAGARISAGARVIAAHVCKQSTATAKSMGIGGGAWPDSKVDAPSERLCKVRRVKRLV